MGNRLGAKLIASLLLGGLLSGCVAGTSAGGGESTPDQKSASKPATVEFWTINLKKTYGDYIQGLIDDFEQQNPKISVKWVDVPGEDIQSKFLAAVASGNPPDAVQLVDVYIDQFAESLSDLSPYFPEARLGDYIPQLVDSVRRDDNLLGIPWIHGGSPMAWYNQQTLHQAGISPNEAPRTWSQALDFGRTVAKRTNKCGFNGLPAVDVLRSEGIQVVNQEGTKATLNTPKAATILNDWRDAYRDGAVCQGAVSENIRNFPQTVENGLAASVVGSFQGLPANLINVKLDAPGAYRSLDVSHGVTGSTGTYIIPGINTLNIPAKSDVKEQAAKLIGFVTSPQAQLAFCKLAPLFPSTVTTLKAPLFTNSDGINPIASARKMATEQLSTTITADLPQTTKDVELDAAYLEDIRAFMTGDQPAAAVLSDVQSKWNDILQQD